MIPQEQVEMAEGSMHAEDRLPPQQQLVRACRSGNSISVVGATPRHRSLARQRLDAPMTWLLGPLWVVCSFGIQWRQPRPPHAPEAAGAFACHWRRHAC